MWLSPDSDSPYSKLCVVTSLWDAGHQLTHAIVTRLETVEALLWVNIGSYLLVQDIVTRLDSCRCALLCCLVFYKWRQHCTKEEWQPSHSQLPCACLFANFQPFWGWLIYCDDLPFHTHFTARCSLIVSGKMRFALTVRGTVVVSTLLHTATA